MAPVKPMLDGVELPQAQRIASEDEEVLAQHGVPALEGDFLQDLGRRATRVTLTGVLTGPEAGEDLKGLREKFQAAQPVPFVADIATATRVDKVLIEEMGVRELSGKIERFEYALSLREYTPPPAVTEEPPPEIPPPELPETATLVVEVIVEGDPAFDFSRVTVTVTGTDTEGVSVSRTLANRAANVWTETDFPPGQYTVQAVVTEPPQKSGSAPATVQAGQTAQVTITLQSGAIIAKAFIVHFWFDRSFVEPCMRAVLRQVARHAQDHPDEKLLVVGHTDLTGPENYNQSLSERRARAVFAALTFGRARVAALAEWDALRKLATGGLPSLNDNWGVREYQYILQDLGHYSGNVDGQHGPVTDAAVRTFQKDRGLAPVDGVVGNDTWRALIEVYLRQDALDVPENRFLPNCPNEILKWLGCGEQDPVLNTQDAWRPNRRVELLFVRATTLPCQVPQPDTFNLPAPGAVAGGWCLGPGNPNARCCFLSRGTPAPGQWQVQPAEPGTIIVRGSMRFEDGTPVANTPYVLIAPDGENMDGEGTTAPNRGRPIPGRTALDGAFSYPAKPKGIGVYTLEVQGPFVVRRAGEPPEAAKGNVVCKRLDGSSDFDVIVLPAPGDPSATGSFQVGRLEYTEVQEGTFDLPLPGGGGATFTVRRRAIIRYPADVGGAGAQVSARQAAYPLIVILHGNHRRFRPNGTFVESYRGFDYLASHLASHGYIAISIDVDDINARPDLIFGRGEAILEHIAIMDRRNTTDPQLAGRIDLGTIGLIGHSRGGEGVLAAEQLNVSRGLGLGIRAIVSIAPTNFEDFVHNTTPLLLLYGSSDGDVSGADDGVNPFLIYDRAAPLKAMIFVYAAIHNRFSTNSDWLDPTQIDNDDARRISEADHQNIAKGFSLAFFERHFRAQLGFEPLFKRYGRPGSVAHVELHHQLTDPASLLVDDFDQAGHDATQNTLGNVVTETGLANPDGQAATLVEVSLRRSDTLFFIHNTFGGMIAWDASGGTYTTTLNALDASSFRVLACRVTQRLGSARNPVNLSQDFLVRLNDTSGQSAAVEVGTVTGIPFPFVRHDHNVLHPPALGSTRFVDVLPDHPDLSKSALKTLRIPLSTFKAKNPRIDLASLQTLSFEFQTTATGEIAVDEIEFSN